MVGGEPLILQLSTRQMGVGKAGGQTDTVALALIWGWGWGWGWSASHSCRLPPTPTASAQPATPSLMPPVSPVPHATLSPNETPQSPVLTKTLHAAVDERKGYPMVLFHGIRPCLFFWLSWIVKAEGRKSRSPSCFLSLVPCTMELFLESKLL